MRAFRCKLVALLLACTAGSAAAQVAQQNTLTLDGAKRVMASAVAFARENKARGAIAVVDNGGHLLVLERLDATFAAAAEIAYGKARTAALFQRPTKVFEEIIRQGRTSMVTLPDFTPLQGGIPIEFDGEIVGAVGVSGAASAQQDEDMALAAVNGFTAGAPRSVGEATFWNNTEVTAAFAKGAPLVEVADYKIHASRREEAGQAEVHAIDTDILYVLDGSATLVTGGTVVDGKPTAPNEIRGSGIRDGMSRRIAKGDVVVVPAGTPHWFQAVKGPMTYYVVKVVGGAT